MSPAKSPHADLGWRLRIGWGIGSLGASTLLNGVTFLVLFYLTRVLGLPPALAGTLLFAAKLYDIVTDPLMGVLSDRTRSRYGRRRPWLLAGAVLSALSFASLFNAPDLSPAALVAWAAGALLLYATGYTLFIVPYLAMPAEMTGDYHERSRLMSARVVFAALGILASGAIAPALVTAFGGGREAYRAMSLILAGLIGITMFACFLATATTRSSTAPATVLSTREQWSLALGNRPFLFLIGSKLLHLFGVAVSNSSLLFVITVVLGRSEAAAGVFGLAAVAGTLASMPAWLWASRRLGKRNTYLVAVAIYLPLLLTWLIASPQEPPWALIVRGVAIGVVTGGLTLTAQAMLPDAIDHDAERTGLRREATFAAVYSAVEKIASALGPLAFGLVLEAAGSAGAEPGSVIRTAVAWMPALASLLSAVALLGYQLDRSLRSRDASRTSASSL
jgi:GPH family glycoside/pentoside/hexuronide:cation symporter